jgi:hypothetical protein
MLHRAGHPDNGKWHYLRDSALKALEATSRQRPDGPRQLGDVGDDVGGAGPCGGNASIRRSNPVPTTHH